jgi:hypothetical protein
MRSTSRTTIRIKTTRRWNGNASELLGYLDQIVGDKASKHKYWHKTVLSLRINEIKTNLREVGIFIKEDPKQDPVTGVKTMVMTKLSDIGKMPFEQLEQFCIAV